MKKHILILMVIVSLIVTNGLLAQGPDRKFQPDRPHMAKPDLGLSEEQIEKIEDLELKLEKELLPLKSQLPAIESNLKREMVASQFNEAQVKSLLDQKAKLVTEIRLKRILQKRAIRDLLTPEQQKKFDLHTLKQKIGGHRRLGMPQRPFEPDAEPPQPDDED